MSAHFFLSYANADEDGYVAMFFRDLVREVQQLSGVMNGEVGFRDRSSMQVGAAWPEELLAALNGARSFVPLFSPSYFASEFCGREWTMFAARRESYRKKNGSYPPTLLPVLWVPARDLPDVARQIQFNHESLGRAYAEKGLYHLLRLKRYRAEYFELLRGLAERVLDVGEEYATPPLEPDYEVAATPSAFHVARTAASSFETFAAGVALPLAGGAPETRSTPVAQPAPPPNRSGPKHVHFVIVSAASRELAEGVVRNELRHYGAGPFDWTPYWPELDQRISVFAQAVAARQDLSSGLSEAADVIDVLDRAAARNELVVILVDIWTTRLDTYRAHMLAYDVRNEPASAVMVPWSRWDGETTANGDQLFEDLRRTFPRNMLRGGDLFRAGIETSVEFGDDLADVITRVQRMVFRERPVGRRAGGTSRTEQPILQFPDPEADR